MNYFVYGPNHFANRYTVAQIVSTFTNNHGSEGIESYTPATLTVQQLPEILQSMSLFSSHRLVLFEGLSQDKALWDRLADTLQPDSETLDVVIIEGSPDKRTKLFKQLNSSATVHASKDLSEPELVRWIVDEATELSSAISRSDAQLLVRRVGLDQNQLHQELQKLAAHPTISTSLITELTEPSLQSTAFELLDSVMSSQPERVRGIIAQLKSSEDPYRLFGLLASQVFALALIDAASGSTTQATIAKDAGVHPFVVSKLSPHAKRLSRSRINQIIEYVAQCDDAMKSSGIDPWECLESTLIKSATV